MNQLRSKAIDSFRIRGSFCMKQSAFASSLVFVLASIPSAFAVDANLDPRYSCGSDGAFLKKPGSAAGADIRRIAETHGGYYCHQVLTPTHSRNSRCSEITVIRGQDVCRVRADNPAPQGPASTYYAYNVECPLSVPGRPNVVTSWLKVDDRGDLDLCNYALRPSVLSCFNHYSLVRATRETPASANGNGYTCVSPSAPRQYTLPVYQDIP